MYFFTKFKPDIKPKIENLQDELHQLESKHVKVQSFVQMLGKTWKTKYVPKHFSKYLNDKICKIKQFPSHIQMIRKQNIVTFLIMFLNQLKTFMKNFISNRQSSKVSLLYFLAKFLTENLK